MNRTWQFGDLEFVVLWEQLQGDFLPHPFLFTSRTPLYDDYLREKREVAEQVSQRLDGSIAEVLDAVAHPDIRIIVNGWDVQEAERPDGRIRMIATRRGDKGYLVTQVPGETVFHSGGFTIIECDPIRLADAVVAALPKATPGADAEIQLTPPDVRHDDFDYEYGQSRVSADPVDGVAYGAARFLNRPPAVVGAIDVVQGSSVFGPRGISRHRLEWRDLLDDGRYAIGHVAPWKAIAVDAQKLTAMINVRIAEVIRVIRDERG
ncbi:ESX secretion-associated protein EspG [Nocardia sp. NPDC004582]